ncbi:uncharacterized protein LOC105423755 [Pogonomyrmex barbatus]|uniref:Uncharacterized protein LOC105423755 n=1 Tax=Pogonomyrmex barbatus TaxID=144034 RepID=A0A6I9W0S5_9HYME|nr:uncharacterized protein LOC105423755 [Pogonomyrmex barbatus]
MIEFKLSVPNKISLFGEHMLPYGYSGVAAGIELRTRMSFTEVSDVNRIVIKFPQIDLHFDKPLKEFLRIYKKCVSNKSKREIWHEQVSQYITTCTSLTCTNDQRLILVAFFYLLICIAEKEKIRFKSFEIYLSTQLKIDTVFPCPSSFAVCFATGFLYWSRLQKGVVQNSFSNDDLKKILHTASLCTKISSKFQEVDIIVCTYGSTIVHRKTYMEGQASINWDTFNMPEMIVLLVDSNKLQSLQEQLQEITIKSNVVPNYIQHLITYLNNETIIAVRTLFEIDSIQKNNQLNAITRYEKLMSQQRELKMALSHLVFVHYLTNTTEYILE